MRLDKYLYDYLSVKSRTFAAELIKNGQVECDGKIITKASFEVPSGSVVRIVGDVCPYPSRAALKLVHALEVFGADPSGLVCLDVGASTGGFTDVLLKSGAKKVYAVDSGHGQLADDLLRDQRVCSIEGFNARNLTPGMFAETPEFAVCDVSFISQTLLHTPICEVLKENGTFISLIKPQFELTPKEISKGGIVKEVKHRLQAIKRVIGSLGDSGFAVKGLTVSPITGGDGNIEYLVYAEKHGGGIGITEREIERIVLYEGRDSTEKGQ